MHWYKVMHGAHRDQKIYKVAAKLGVPAGYVSYMWVDMLDYASQHKDRGSIHGFDPEGSLAMVGFPPENGEMIMSSLRSVGLIEDGRIKNWEKYQAANKDPSAAERKRRQREREKEATVTERDSHDKNGTVTTDLDLEKDKNKNPPTPPRTGGGYSDLFEQAWKKYRKSNDSKQDAWKAWKARLKEGHSEERMLAGVERYMYFCELTQTEDQHRKRAKTFFGPGLHFELEWSIAQLEQKPKRRWNEPPPPASHTNNLGAKYGR
jgi:hypothetical protein